MSANLTPYVEARQLKGVWQAHRFGILRRVAQLAFLALFLTGPLLGVWIAKGTLASSLTFGVLPLTDPFILVQSLATRHWPEATALIGAATSMGEASARSADFWLELLAHAMEDPVATARLLNVPAIRFRYAEGGFGPCQCPG